MFSSVFPKCLFKDSQFYLILILTLFSIILVHRVLQGMQMSLEELNQTFRNIIEEIMYSTVNIDDPCERVFIMQWIRKLQSLDDRTVPVAMLRNEYAEYLRITLSNDTVYLCAPFKEPPPEDELRPLCEVLANYIATKCPPIPMTGPIQPVMTQFSEDGKVFTTVRQSPDGGIFCYMAVTPDSFEEFK